mmetsp:Transcript_2511/g.3695  ORF Transcript_2511/g.3695 Transcript_2511/m.3695 type:complete len:670 (-) Transcript_2511:69-2078(-)
MSNSYTSASLGESKVSTFNPSAKYDPSVNDAKSRRQLVIDPLSSDDDSDEALESQRLNALEEFEDGANIDPEEGLPFYQKRRGKLIIAVAAIVLIVLAAIVAVGLSSTGGDGDAKSNASGINSNSVPTLPPFPTEAPSTLRPTISEPEYSPIEYIIPSAPPIPNVSGPSFDSIYERLVTMLKLRGVTNEVSFTSVGTGAAKTSQVRAAEWLVRNDPLRLLGANSKTPLARVFQRYVLVAIYYELNGANWKNNDGWLSDDHECRWYGVSCADKTIPSTSLFEAGQSQIGQLTTEEQVLVQLDLEENGLSGNLPDEIGSLSDCTVLSVYGNDIAGTLPSSLGQMVALNKLWLEDNEFSGSLPSEIGYLRNVDDLSFYENQIEGTLPTELGQLTRLERLWANNMRITGRLPTEFGMLSKLENLYLDVNFLSGSIPRELGLATNLRDLRLFRNSLGGTLPINLFSLTKLEILYLDTNKFKGEIPNEIGGLLSIKDLQLFTNDLTGSVPFAISLLQNLQILRLNANDLTGNIPALLGTNLNLLRVTLSDNRLVGTIPDSLQYSSSIRRIEFDRNSLEGTLPEWIGNLDELLTLNVANNRLTGLIPTSLSALKQLEEVKLEQNDFSGRVPREWCELESLSNGILTADCSGILPEVECGCCTSCFEIMVESRIGGH